METNENRNVNDIKETNENKIDMQATQRIVFLGDFASQKDNEIKEEFTEKNNDDVINEEKIKENDVEIINNNSNSEISTDSNAQSEQLSNSEASVQNVQTTPNKITNEPIIENSENKAEIVPEKTDENAEIDKIKKEKQHAQDKKDYRLERMLFDRINTMQGKIKESLELIKKFERINAKEENLPNIVTTLHDKLTHEVIKQFRTVGIEFNMKSYLVQSVVSDLLGRFEEGITEFKDCSENLNFVREVQDDFESRVELAPTSKVKNFFARIRGIFKPERKQERLEELERERQEKKLEEANIHLIKYKFINSELERYTIRKNIVNSLTREILHGQGSGLTLNVKDFIEERITPEMKKLGLEGQIPELEKNIYEEYKLKQDIPNEEFEKLSIGEIRKNMKSPRMEVLRTKLNTVVAGNNDEIERLVV